MENNKLFCTFASPTVLQENIEHLIQKYTILYDKIFILKSPDTDEFILTYNIDMYNMACKNMLPNTILVHRRKEFRTLYTINALNALVCELNGGRPNSNYQINWSDFRNTILLTQEGRLKKINTRIHDIVKL